MIDLNAPLGMGQPRRRRRALLVLGGGAAVFALVALVAVFALGDPHGGEPYAVATLPPPSDPTPTGSLAPRPAQPPAAEPATAPQVAVNPPAADPPAAKGPFDGGTLENGVKVYRGTTPTAGPARGPLVIDVSRQLDAVPKFEAMPKVEAVPKSAALHPEMPRPDTLRSAAPSLAIPGAASSDLSQPALAAGPRIAIVIGNMGLSQTATVQAIEAMPPAVTLAFLPYGGTVAANVAAAQAKGHEVLLQLPMENADAPAPGPHALRANEGAEALAGDLDWLLGRFKGYSGLSNLLGAPVTADAGAMAAIAKAAAARGLFFAEDGTSPRSTVLGAAAHAGVPAVAADVLLDATGDPTAVRANLDRLVETARRRGSAIGVASGLPEHLALIARFAAELPGKNIALVPVGTLARRSPTVATITR